MDREFSSKNGTDTKNAVLIINGDYTFRRGITSIINNATTYELIGQAESRSQALRGSVSADGKGHKQKSRKKYTEYNYRTSQIVDPHVFFCNCQTFSKCVHQLSVPWIFFDVSLEKATNTSSRLGPYVLILTISKFCFRAKSVSIIATVPG